VICQTQQAATISAGNHIIAIKATFTGARVCAVSSLLKTIQVQVAPAALVYSLSLNPPAAQLTGCKAAQAGSPTTVYADFAYQVTAAQAVPGLVFADPVVSSSAPLVATCTAPRPSEWLNAACMCVYIRIDDLQPEIEFFRT
jgi:hypothetical protein